MSDQADRQVAVTVWQCPKCFNTGWFERAVSYEDFYVAKNITSNRHQFGCNGCFSTTALDFFDGFEGLNLLGPFRPGLYGWPDEHS